MGGISRTAKASTGWAWLFARPGRMHGRGDGCGQRCFARAGSCGWIATLQLIEAVDHGAVFMVAFALGAGGFDGAKDAAQNVHQGQQTADDLGIGRELPLAQETEQIFSGVRERFEAAEAEEAGRALDGMHGAEDVRQQLSIARARFQVGEAPLHAVQALLAFEQEFASKVVHERFIGWSGANLRGRGVTAGCSVPDFSVVSETLCHRLIL